MTAANIDLSHLCPEVRSHVLESDEARIRRIRADRFIPFSQVTRALSEVERLLRWPESVNMPNLLVSAESGMGKTTLVAKLLRDHPPGMRDAQGVISRAVIMMEIPSPDETRIYTHLLKSLGAPVAPQERLSVLEDRALGLLEQIKPRLLIFDEIHNLLLGSYRQQRCGLNLLKLIGNKLRVPIFALGTGDARMAIGIDAQLDSRFNKIPLTRWQPDAEFRSFVASLVSVLPLRRASALDEPVALKQLLARTGGTTRNLVRLIQRAAEEAVQSGSERIDNVLLEMSARAQGFGE